MVNTVPEEHEDRDQLDHPEKDCVEPMKERLACSNPPDKQLRYILETVPLCSIPTFSVDSQTTAKLLHHNHTSYGVRMEEKESQAREATTCKKTFTFSSSICKLGTRRSFITLHVWCTIHRFAKKRTAQSVDPPDLST
jgi:hypothetical protein